MAGSSTQAATLPKTAVASPKSPTPPKPPKSASSHPAAEAEGGEEQHPEEQHLEVDHDRDDDENTLNERLSTFTASLSSSVLDYPMEHGRRYHAYQKGSYVFPNDDKREQERLDVVHHMVARLLGGRFWLAPIDENEIQNALDIGTGTGILAVEIADALPGAQVIGCDLSPIQSTWIPPNLKFEVDDVEKEWTYPFKFDFVVSRYMCGSIGDWRGHVKRIYENLTPGGWVELQDFDATYTSDDGSLTPENYLSKWSETFNTSMESINRTVRPCAMLRSYAETAGFINIREVKLKVPLGPWPKDPKLKEIGMMNLVQTLDGLEAFSLKTLEATGWSRMEIEVFLANVRREIKSNECHTYVPFHVVYGQKPEVA